MERPRDVPGGFDPQAGDRRRVPTRSSGPPARREPERPAPAGHADRLGQRGSERRPRLARRLDERRREHRQDADALARPRADRDVRRVPHRHGAGADAKPAARGVPDERRLAAGVGSREGDDRPRPRAAPSRGLARRARGSADSVDLGRAWDAGEARYLLYLLAHASRGQARASPPGRPGVVVLHKSGWVDAARHDAGLVVWEGACSSPR